MSRVIFLPCSQKSAVAPASNQTRTPNGSPLATQLASASQNNGPPDHNNEQLDPELDGDGLVITSKTTQGKRKGKGKAAPKAPAKEKASAKEKAPAKGKASQGQKAKGSQQQKGKGKQASNEEPVPEPWKGMKLKEMNDKERAAYRAHKD
ncbi:hypothetical protein H4Q26_010848 [Puccinia striiformis f. sp. tritici PST-130]|nr:hypothetical protein H4Q26_010848 [Puccinia striiformis f. sp. tritici PST-130]